MIYEGKLVLRYYEYGIAVTSLSDFKFLMVTNYS